MLNLIPDTIEEVSMVTIKDGFRAICETEFIRVSDTHGIVKPPNSGL